jgi:hypothetical protein
MAKDETLATSEEIVKLVEGEGAQRVLIWGERIQVTAPFSAEEEWRR